MGSPVVVASPRKSPSYNRRANKPLVEKKRRARINGCLGQLKSLILGAMQTEGAQVSRLEKADILEMTVKYLQHMQHQQVATEPEVVTKFSAGYTECASEVIRYIEAVNCVSPEVKANLENHLVERLRGSVPQVPVQHQAQPLASRQNANPVSQFSHANSFTSQKNLVPASSIEIDIANKAAAEALKRPQRVSPVLLTTPRVSVSGIRQTTQAAPVSPKSGSPKIEVRGGQELFNELRARHESGMGQVLHPIPRLSRSQSTSPPHARHLGDNSRLLTEAYNTGDRERHNSSEPSHYTHTMAYNHQVCPPTAYSHEVYIPSNIDHQHVMHTVKSESESHNSDYDRPLHIHIPDSPRIPSTPSPPFNPPGLSYHPNETNISISSSNNPATSLEDSPPTILYGFSQRSISPVYKTETDESSRFTDNNSSIPFSEYTHDPAQVSYKFTDSGYANDSRVVSAVPATPSPPMLTREEPFPTHISQPYRTGSYCQDNFGSEQSQSNIGAMQAQHCYMQEQEQFTTTYTPENTFMEYPSQCGGRFYEVKSCDQPDIRRQQQYRSEVISPQQYSGIHQSSNVCISHVPAPRAEEQAKNQQNEQSVVNGPTPQQSALSRQKDTPLSLKRRILDGLGSEGEWMPSGIKKSRQQEQTTCAQVPSKEKDFIAVGEVICKVSAHCTADDSLWRPW